MCTKSSWGCCPSSTCPRIAESWGALEGDGRQVGYITSHLAVHRVYAVSSTTKTTVPQLQAGPYLQTLHRLKRLREPTFSTKTTRKDQGSNSGLTCTNSPKFSNLFANLSCSLLTHHTWTRDCTEGIDTAALGVRANFGLIKRTCRVCGSVCSYLFPLWAFSYPL